MSAGASPQTTLGELTALHKPLGGFKEAASRQERNGGEGRTRGGERGNGEGRKRRSWGNRLWLLGCG